MTGYYIGPWYDPSHNADVLWAEIKKATQHFCSHPELIAKAVLATEFGLRESEEVGKFSEAYRNCGDLTVFVEEDKKQVTQYASGGGHEREIKDACRRAFCRLVMNWMHEQHMNVNVTTV